MKYDWRSTLIGFLIYTVYFVMYSTTLSMEVIILINTIDVSLFVFGFAGLFFGYFGNHSAKLR